MNNIFNSRPILISDEYINDFSWENIKFDFVQKKWWSRIYEYQWLNKVIKEYFKEDIKHKTAIDIATGEKHPGMFLLKESGCSRVVGVDLFDISKFLYRENVKNGIEYIQENILFPKIKEKFDIISCISFLEHIEPKFQCEILQNIIDYSKEKSIIVMTFDIPGYEYVTNLDMYIEKIRQHGFNINISEVDNSDILTTKNSNISPDDLKEKSLSCYRLFAFKI